MCPQKQERNGCTDRKAERMQLRVSLTQRRTRASTCIHHHTIVIALQRLSTNILGSSTPLSLGHMPTVRAFECEFSGTQYCTELRSYASRPAGPSSGAWQNSHSRFGGNRASLKPRYYPRSRLKRSSYFRTSETKDARGRMLPSLVAEHVDSLRLGSC